MNNRNKNKELVMFKRVFMILILGAVMVALRGGDAQAHLQGWCYPTPCPTARHVGSYDLIGYFTKVPSPTQHLAIFETVLEVHEAVVYCANPEGRIVDGLPTGPWLATAASTFSEADITEKVKGRAIKTNHLESEGLPWWNDAICSDRNRQWRVGDELILSMREHLWTFDCGDAACTPSLRTPAFHAVLDCAIPPGADRTQIFDYDCILVSEEHCDKTLACVPPSP